MSDSSRDDRGGTGIGRNLRRLSVLVIVMFASLFVAASVIQIGIGDELRDGPGNRRTQLANQNVNRGPILVDGNPIAYSVPTGEEIKYRRVYGADQVQAMVYAPVTGAYSLVGASTGLEAAYDDYLTASTGGQFLTQISAVLSGTEPQGAAVETTIDPVLQQAAWDALGGYTGAVVVLEPSTGRILAMVSKPSYDPAMLADTDFEAALAAYEALLADPGDPLINRAANGDLDPPGSTFKLVVAAAALDSGRFTTESTFDNPSSLGLPQSDAVIENSGGGLCGGMDVATVTLFQAIQYSCNIPMAELAQQLGYEPIKMQARDFGFCHGYDLAAVLEDIEYPCIAAGREEYCDVADTVDLTAMYTTPGAYPSVLDEPQTMLTGFGQCGVRASPLQMAMVAQAIANNGVLMAPTLVESVIAPDLTNLVTIEPRSLGQPISVPTAQALTAMMVASVDSGAGWAAAIDGVTVAGKTGTAENGEGEPYSLWFTGFAPAENPQVVVAVVVQDGGGLPLDAQTSAQVSAPVARAVLQVALGR